MFANSTNNPPKFGNLSKDVHLPGTSRHELIEFIADELPCWRDRSDRKKKMSETALTSQLCAHLNSAARHHVGWDFLQFRIEEPDEQRQGRKIDLVPAPCDATVWIEGRRHVDFDPLLPIECKRLPTPKDTKRDEREYVISRHASTGGIQRFKAGHHGASHTVGAMVAYVQEDTTEVWDKRVAKWINDLVRSGQPGWTLGDLLNLELDDSARRVALFRSLHTRNGLPDIELRHMWVTMN